MRAPLAKAFSRTPWWVVPAVIIAIAIVVYGTFFVGIKKDGERARIVQDLDDRAACLNQYDTPECLKLRLKKAELKQQYEKDIRALQHN